MKNLKKAITFLLFICTSQYIFANAGSGMLWFSFLHLIFINAIIGIVEYIILEIIKIDTKLIWIIIGNYISMFVGIYLIAPSVAYIIGTKDFWGNWTDPKVYGPTGFLIGMTAAFITTLLIEYPFFKKAIVKKNQSQIIKGLVISNSITYIIMTSIYYSLR